MDTYGGVPLELENYSGLECYPERHFYCLT